MKRKTKQREVILGILASAKGHPSADWIYEEAKKELPHISKGTVYRNLKVLRENRAISELSLKGALSRFEIGRRSHYHFRCENCDLVVDVDVRHQWELDEEAARTTGLEIHCHQLEFRGLCLTCQDKTNLQNRRKNHG